MRLVIPALLVSLAACAESSSSNPVTGFEINVAPLTLAGVGRVCYDVRVDNGLDQVVWSKGDPSTSFANGDSQTLCSDQYGNGGAISYVGTCDASQPNHTVRLWVDTIEDESGNTLDDWRDPCPAWSAEDPGGCTAQAVCVANADVPVEFDLFVMRSANQGFFDVAVNFGDIFCSAKLDCSYDDDGAQPIELLFDSEGNRVQTAVVGFACTAGPGDDGTKLHVTEPRVVCGGGGSSVNPHLVAAVSMDTTSSGDLIGFEIEVDDFAPPSSTRIRPVLWEKTGDNTWAAPVRVDTGAFDSGELLTAFGEDFIAGAVFSIETSSPPMLASWQRVGGTWQLAQTHTTSGAGIFPLYFDAVNQRVWIGGTYRADPITGYWNLADNSVHPLEGVGTDGCEVTDFNGSVAVGTCLDGPSVWDLATDIRSSLDVPFVNTDAEDYDPSQRLALLSNGGIVGAVSTNSGSHAMLVLWQPNGAGGYAATPGSDDTGDEIGIVAALSMPFESDDFFVVRLEGEEDALLHRLPGGDFDQYVGGTLDGNSVPVRYHSLTVFDGQPVVFGLAIDGDDIVPVAGFVFDFGGQINLRRLPYTGAPEALDTTILRAVGTNDGTLWVIGGDGNEQTGAEAPLWALTLGDGTVEVAGTRVLDTSDSVQYELIARLPAAPLEPIAALSTVKVASDSTGHAAAWDPFVRNDSPQEPVWMDTDVAFGAVAGSETTVDLDPTRLGNAWTEDPDTSDAVLQYAVYRGAEQMLCNGQPCNKLYWNFAVAFDTNTSNCRLELEATASEPDQMTDGRTPAGVYPFVAYSVPLTDASGMVCRRNGLDDGGGVSSRYTEDGAASFCYGFDGTDVSFDCDL